MSEVQPTEDQVENLRTETRKLEAEIEEIKAHRVQLDTQTEYAAVELLHTKRVSAKARADESNNNVYHFDTDVNSKSVIVCIDTLAMWSRMNPGSDITIIFDSPGGDARWALDLWDFISELKANGHHIITKARGWCASAAAVLFQAGDERIFGKRCFMLIHEGSIGVMGSVAEVEDQMKLSSMMRDQVAEILAENSHLSVEDIKAKWDRKNWWLDSEEALELGFCDKVI